MTPAVQNVVLNAPFNPYRLPNLAARYDLSFPASLTSDYIRIDASNRVSLLADTSGNSAVNCYVSNVAAGSYLSAPNESVTGNQTFTLDLNLLTYAPAGDVTIVDKLSGNDGFKILLLTTGVIRLQVGDGASVTNVDSSESFSMAALTRYTVGIAWTDGVGASFTKDGAAVGTAVAAVKTLTNAVTTCKVGTVVGTIYRFQAGSVYDCNPAISAKLLANNDTFTSGGDTWTLTTTGATGGRICGARDLYMGAVGSQPIYIAAYSQGAEQVANGDFSGGTTSWTPRSSGTIAAVGGELELTGGGGSTIPGFSQNITCVIGRRYRATAVARRGTTTQTVQFAVGTVNTLSGQIGLATTDSTSNSTLTFDFYATATSLFIGGRLAGVDDGATAYFDNISVYAVGSSVPYLYTDGTDDYMKSAPFALVQPETVCFTGSQVSWTAGDVLFDGNATDSSALKQTTSTPQLNLNAGSSVAGNTGLAVGTTGVASAIYNGASSSLRINRGTATTGNAGAANMGGFTLASAGTAGSYGNITLNEILIYSSALNSTTQDRVALFEGRKWGFSV